LSALTELLAGIERCRAIDLAQPYFTGMPHYSHIDALCHYSSNGKLHGGEDSGGLQTYANGLERFSVDTIQPIFAAGSETAPFEFVPNPSMSVHVHLLVESGIHIIECLNLEELAASGARKFLFVATPLRIRGGTASPIRPIALVPEESSL
jgi:hypothetical protein